MADAVPGADRAKYVAMLAEMLGEQRRAIDRAAGDADLLRDLGEKDGAALCDAAGADAAMRWNALAYALQVIEARP